MGCSTSRLDNEEVVRLCKDRKNFVKQAVEQRLRFASGHAAYVQSLQRVSIALRNYIDGDERGGDCFSDSCSSPAAFTPGKRLNPEILKIPCGSSPPKAIPSDACTSTTAVMRYLKSAGNASVSVVEERAQWPEIAGVVDSYCYPANPYGTDGCHLGMQPSPTNPCSYYSVSPCYQESYPPPSPQNSQWDFFWNPFASLENYGYGYPLRCGLDHMTHTDEMAGLRQVREEEGIPDLEEDDDEEELQQQQQQQHISRSAKQDTSGIDMNSIQKTESNDPHAGVVNPLRTHRIHQTSEFRARAAAEGVEIPETQKDVEIDLRDDKGIERNRERPGKEATTPGFTVFVDRRPGSMSEVVREIENQFQRICDSAQEISVMLEAGKAHYSSASNDLIPARLPNPVAIFRTPSSSSRSTSSRFLPASSSYETSCEFSEESCMLSGGSHQSTLDRLYAWEKKLYNEVKCGERTRIAYEKKVMQLRSQDANGEDASGADKTRAAIRELHTRLKISMHTIEAISSRIQRLRDDELHPQIMGLIQGFGRMWRTMADGHRIQQRATDGAKLLLATSKLAEPPPPLIRRTRSATSLESELRNWRCCLEVWIAAQRSYVHALAGWLLRCGPPPPDHHPTPTTTTTTHRSGAPPVFGVCVHWSGLLDSISEARAVDGLDFFAAGIGSVAAQQRELALAAKRASARGKEEEVEEIMVSAAKTAEVAVRVVCAGMSVAMSSLSDFALCSMHGCEHVVARSGGDDA